jgi:hypothetical protein
MFSIAEIRNDLSDCIASVAGPRRRYRSIARLSGHQKPVRELAINSACTILASAGM